MGAWHPNLAKSTRTSMLLTLASVEDPMVIEKLPIQLII